MKRICRKICSILNKSFNSKSKFAVQMCLIILGHFVSCTDQNVVNHAYAITARKKRIWIFKTNKPKDTYPMLVSYQKTYFHCLQG